MMILLRRFVVLFVLLPAVAQAGLQVFPTRVLLSDQRRTSQITMRYTGTQTQRFSVTAVFYRMKPDGSMELIDRPLDSERPGKNYFRFSPRSVELQPGAEQVLRLMLTMPAGVPDGDYRSHLMFEPIGEIDPAQTASTGAGSVAMQLQAKVAVAVPVILRRGRPQVEGAITELSLKPRPGESGKYDFVAKLQRQGNAFLYGDLILFYRPDGAAEETQVARVGGVSHYIDQRQVRYSLDASKAIKWNAGRIRLEYRQPQDEGGGLIGSTEARVP